MSDYIPGCDIVPNFSSMVMLLMLVLVMVMTIMWVIVVMLVGMMNRANLHTLIQYIHAVPFLHFS